MNNKIYDALIKKFRAELLRAVKQDIEPRSRFKNTIPVIKNYLDKLKSVILATPFSDIATEIYFFKAVKPLVYSELIYEVELFNLSSAVKLGTKEMMLENLRNELKQVNRLFDQYAFHYHYYKLGIVELDHEYFIRGAEVNAFVPPEVPAFDPSFSTAMGYLFAKFMAYERLRLFIIDEIVSIECSAFTPVSAIESGNELFWTGDAINLVELAYGIWLTNQLNNGKATITGIIGWLERSLHVNIGRAYRRWTEISQRKQISLTKFMDQMRAAILKRIDDELKR